MLCVSAGSGESSIGLLVLTPRLLIVVPDVEPICARHSATFGVELEMDGVAFTECLHYLWVERRQHVLAISLSLLFAGWLGRPVGQFDGRLDPILHTSGMDGLLYLAVLRQADGKFHGRLFKGLDL